MKSKTWSREFATLLVIFLCYLAIEGKTEELEVLSWPTFIFAMAAFGFKQPEVQDRIRGNKDGPEEDYDK